MAHALYELAQHQDIQDKLRREIRDTYKKNGETMTYADIKEMKYLDKVFKGTYLKLLQYIYWNLFEKMEDAFAYLWERRNLACNV